MAATGSLGARGAGDRAIGEDGIELQSFLESAGRSLTGAQEALGSPVNLQTDLVIASAELEAKVALKTDSAGRLAVQPLSSQDLLQSGLSADGISTLRISFVATAGETPPGTPAIKPSRKPAEVIAEVRERQDVATLQKILGDLKFEAAFVPQTRRWMVTAQDAKGRLVREVVLSDQAE